MKKLKSFDKFNESSSMELDELYNTRKRLEKKIDDFDGHTGDPYYQDLLERLESVEEEIAELEKK